MPIVKVKQSFTYRDAVFEEGKLYDVREIPEGFVTHWFVDGKRGEVLDVDAAPKNAEVLPDPRFPEAEEEGKSKKKSKAADADKTSESDKEAGSNPSKTDTFTSSKDTGSTPPKDEEEDKDSASRPRLKSSDK